MFKLSTCLFKIVQLSRCNYWSLQFWKCFRQKRRSSESNTSSIVLLIFFLASVKWNNEKCLKIKKYILKNAPQDLQGK